VVYDADMMAAGLSGWVAVESPTSDRDGVNRMMDLVAAELQGLPVGVERIAGVNGLGDMLVARAGPDNGEGAILVLSHLDTVHPVGTIDHDLPLRREGDRLYGPGVYDMKGGAYLALQAFKDVAIRGGARRPVVFLFTPDEEIGSPTSRGLIEAHAHSATYALVTEPGRDGGKVVTARKGVGRFEVTIEGRPAHAGARHELGRSAIREAAHQILAIESMTDYSRGITTNVGRIRGGTADNVVPQKVWFTVDLRVVEPIDAERCSDAIKGLSRYDSDCILTVSGGMNRPPMPPCAANERLLCHAAECAKQLGFEIEAVPLTGGGSDGNFTAALGVATLDGLGIDGDGAHTLSEYGLISSLVPRAHLMARLFETL
jgi:glutamate carboxypeptidase